MLCWIEDDWKRFITCAIDSVLRMWSTQLEAECRDSVLYNHSIARKYYADTRDAAQQ